MDETDRAILHHLQVDGRMSNLELAEKVRLTPSPCLRRVRALEAAGVITGYHAFVDPVALGRGFHVLVHVNMMVKDRATIEAFETAVVPLDEVLECRRMFGDPDYLLWVAVADVGAYERFYMASLTDLPGVARMNSQFTMKVIKPGARPAQLSSGRPDRDRKTYRSNASEGPRHRARGAGGLVVAPVRRTGGAILGRGHDAGHRSRHLACRPPSSVPSWTPWPTPTSSATTRALLPDCTPGHARRILDRVRAAVPARRTCAVGLTYWIRGEPHTVCIARADTALQDAEGNGRNSISVRLDGRSVARRRPGVR